VTEIHRLSALELADAMRRREISPVEVVEHYLIRIEAWDARVGAFATVTAERARVAALAAEQRILDTDDPAELPALLGVPIGIKDMHAEAGVPMKLGSLAYADFIPDWDEDVVVALRHAGTISLGKTNTPELGLPCYTEPDPRIAPPARTPYDLTRSAGGSSGGAAAAVAAGLVAFAPGSDGGGSIRIPASVCGLVGLKTTRGLVSNGPRRAEGPGLAVQGPSARTVADAAALLDAMVSGPGGGSVLAPTTSYAEKSYAENARRDPGRLRIGRCIDNIHGAPVDPACREAWERASAQLAALGHHVEDVPVPPLAVHYPRFVEVWSVGAASVPVEPDREDLLLPMTRWLRELGRGVSGVTYATAIATIQVAVRDHLAATAAYDVILTPTLAQLPALVGSQRDDADPAADFDAQGRFTPFTAIYNLTGQPALSMPLHRTVEGLPVGVQLAGRPGADATLLALGAQLESTLDASTRTDGGVPIP
jgi:amidase